jgi:uncharacterized protein YraI
MSLSCGRRFLLTLSAAALLVTAAANAATYRTTVRATLRTSSDAQSASLATLPGGTEVDVSSCSKSWCKASWNGRHGWIARRAVIPAKSQQPSSGRGYRKCYPIQWFTKEVLTVRKPNRDKRSL